MEGSGSINVALHPKTKKKRRISLSCILASIVVTYLLFVYLVMVRFEAGKENLYGSGPSQLRQENSSKNDAKAQATLEDFCGSCIFKDSTFNCYERIDWVIKNKKMSKTEAMMSNLKYCLKDGIQYVETDLPQSTKIHAEMEWGPELQPILSGSFIKDISLDEITIAHPNFANNQMEGLEDRRKAQEVLGSVLYAAKYGDRQYEIEEEENPSNSDTDKGDEESGRSVEMPVLTAYCEPVNQTTWETKPLPIRPGPATKASLLPVEFPHVKSCTSLQSQWPIDTPPVDIDPFLPWIHDVFPSADGKNVVFIAQNRRRCFNGQRGLSRGEKVPKGVTVHKGFIHIDYQKNYFMRPQSALFQHIPVKKITVDNEKDDEPRYRLASHEDADPNGMETRMICRFKTFDLSTGKQSVVGYSLSEFEIDYDYHTYRKGYLHSATAAGYDNHMIWQSQLLFKCPIPSEFHEQVKSGDTVEDDYATLFVDVVPIRTPPRYTPPREFFPPRYNFKGETEHLFVADDEFGKEHVLPKIDESGRWENIVSLEWLVWPLT